MQVVKRSNLSDRQGTFTLQADTQEAVGSPEARSTVLRDAAAAGLTRPGISSTGGAYPVDADGKHDDAVMTGQRPTVAYRCDFVVTAGL